MENLIEAFEDAKEEIPFLVLEVGYTRVTGYMVHMWDSSGCGIKKAPKIFTCQSEDFNDVSSEAVVKINDYKSKK